MDDLGRLEAIFHQPASIVALESFNEIVHRPSETMIESLLDLFNNALRQNLPCTSLRQDPLFIVVLINRLIQHSSSSSPSQPSRAQLSSTFQRFLFIFINLEFNCPFHPQLLERIKKQLSVCMTKLAIRIISSYHSNVDPILELINPIPPLFSLENTQIPTNHPHFEATSACLAVIKNVLSFFDHAKSIDSDSIIRKITKNHFETLYEIYNRLVAASLSVSHGTKTNNEYQKIVKPINLLLKIFKMMIKPLAALSSSSSTSPRILDWLSISLLKDFQTYMDSELIQMNNSKNDNINYNEGSTNFLIPELNTFNSHICQYGDIMLQIQSYQSSVITPEVLLVYLKIVEHVSTELVSIHNHPLNQTLDDHSDNTHQSDSTHTSGKKLIKFYPLLNQALKLLNNSLNPWISFEDDSLFSDITVNSNQQIHSKLSNNLNRQETIKLLEILQPLLNFQFGLQSYLDGRTQHQISDDSDEEDEEDSGEEHTETSMEMEDKDPEDQTDLRWENQSNDREKEEEDHILNEETENQEDYVQNLSSTNNVFNEKFENFNTSHNVSYSAFYNTHTNNRNFRSVVDKEPLQIEIEDLIQNLKLINQNHY